MFHEFLEAVFHGVEWNSYYTLTVSGRGHSNDKNRVQAQKVHIYRSDRCIALKFGHECPEAVFHGVTWNRYYSPTASSRGHSIDMTRVSAQKFHIYRCDRWITLKMFHEFWKAVFHGVPRNPYYPPTASGRGHSANRNRVLAQKVCIYRSNSWIALKFFHEFPEVVFHGVA